MFLPLLAAGSGLLVQADVVIGTHTSGSSTVTVWLGSAPIITQTPGSIAAHIDLLSTLSGIYQATWTGASSGSGLAVLCNQLTGITTVQINQSDAPGTWTTLTWNGTNGYTVSGAAGVYAPWDPADTGTTKVVRIRALG